MSPEKPWDKITERRAEGLNIPYPLLGIMFTLIIQTLGGVWWASAMSAKLGFMNDGQIKLEKAIGEASLNRYTSLDASRDLATYDRRLNIIESTISENKRIITDIQIKMNKQ